MGREALRYWHDGMGKTGANLDTNPPNVIMDRLDDGYTPEGMTGAIERTRLLSGTKPRQQRRQAPVEEKAPRGGGIGVGAARRASRVPMGQSEGGDPKGGNRPMVYTLYIGEQSAGPRGGWRRSLLVRRLPTAPWHEGRPGGSARCSRGLFALSGAQRSERACGPIESLARRPIQRLS